MALLDLLYSGAVAVHEDARGRILRGELDDTVSKLLKMLPDQRLATASRFLVIQNRVRWEMRNWTREGRLEMASQFRNEGRKQVDFNVVDGFAAWMVSAWLEASARQSDGAKSVYVELENFRRDFLAGLSTAKRFQPEAAPPLAYLTDRDMSAVALLATSTIMGMRLRLELLPTEKAMDVIRAHVQSHHGIGDRLVAFGLGVSRALARLTGKKDEPCISAAFGAVLALGVDRDHAVAVYRAMEDGGPPLYDARQLQLQEDLALAADNAIETAMKLGLTNDAMRAAQAPLLQVL